MTCLPNCISCFTQTAHIIELIDEKLNKLTELAAQIESISLQLQALQRLAPYVRVDNINQTGSEASVNGQV